MTYRLLSGLIDRLPPEGHYKTAVRDSLSDAQLGEAIAANRATPGHGPWSHTDLLIAALIDSVNTLRHAVIAVAGVKAKEPKPYPRPGVGLAERVVDPRGTAMLAARRQRHLDRQTAAQTPQPQGG
ncbi:MAG: hypothetical protein EPO06_12035 [Burkholderiaceae bacterium]|nr:MAG: hypothetical protein EPO06_12035 [Burkholderiaceae bacterium]